MICYCAQYISYLPSFSTRRSSDLTCRLPNWLVNALYHLGVSPSSPLASSLSFHFLASSDAFSLSLHQVRSEDHTSELQSLRHLVFHILLETNKLILTFFDMF